LLFVLDNTTGWLQSKQSISIVYLYPRFFFTAHHIFAQYASFTSTPFYLRFSQYFPKFRGMPIKRSFKKFSSSNKQKSFPFSPLIECFMQKRIKYPAAYSCVAGSKLTSNRKPTVTNTKEVVDGIALEYHEFHK